jgi:hypothetical protein
VALDRLLSWAVPVLSLLAANCSVGAQYSQPNRAILRLWREQTHGGGSATPAPRRKMPVLVINNPRWLHKPNPPVPQYENANPRLIDRE